MLRVLARFAVLLMLLGALVPVARAQESAPESPEVDAKKRIGFYFGLRLTKLSFAEPADDIGIVLDAPPPLPGIPFSLDGDPIDTDFRSRLNLEFFVGFRLRGSGSVEATFIQWDEKQDLYQEAPQTNGFFNSLASPLAGLSEDMDGDGDVNGIEGGDLAEIDNRAADIYADGAEDVNFSGGAPEFLKFDTSDRIVGEASTDYQTFDVDYRRTFKDGGRLHLDWRAGIRIASIDQTYDVGYRQLGSFAVFVDEELDAPVTAYVRCPPPPAPGGRDLWGQQASSVQDGDGDGDNPSQFEADGDGFLDGNCNNSIEDRLISIPTLSEDRVVANISTNGYGVKMGMDARLDLSKNKKWRLVGSVGVSALHTTVEHRWRETFTSERDRYLNFIDWDFNRDGVYDMLDLDFDGSCGGVASADCTPTTGDSAALGGVYAVTPIRYRDGIQASVSPTARGLNDDAYRGANDGTIREGDPVGESERNRDILRETTLLADFEGKASGIKPVLDLQLGLEWQFSKFAHVGFGMRTSTWFDAGKFRSIADDVAAGRTPEADGNFNLTGAYVTLTVVPR
jgi:hypothetical protein